MTVFHEEALRLVSLGYHVFQCLPRSKFPNTETAPNGCVSASGDPKTISDWWTRFPDCNVGIRCDNVLVIDLDNKNGKKGSGDFSRVVDRVGPVPEGPISLSGNGGYHLLFQRPDADIKGVNGLKWDGKKTGIDIQVGNQYIVAPPSIHPENGKSYKWHTDLCPVDKLPALPDAWIKYVLPHRKETADNRQQTAGSIVFPSTSRLQPSAYSPIERCRLYVDKVPPCIAGQDGDKQLFIAACIIFWDFGLSESEGMPLLQEYNARCLPPWPHYRLVYKMKEALKVSHDKPRGFKLEENSNIKTYNDVDLSGILVQTQPKSNKSHEPMPERLLYVPGFVHDVSQFSVSGAPHPNPQMATLGALACQSFLVSRKVRSELTARPSVYLLALAGSGTGKDFPRQVNQFILTHIGMESHIVDACASGEGLEDLILIKQTLLMQTDEFNFMLSDFAKGQESRFRSLESVILRLYSAARGSYTGRVKAGKEKPLTVQQPGLIIFGTATPERFRRALTLDMIEGGLASRCIVVESDERCRGQRSKEVEEVPESILETANYWATFSPVNLKTGKPSNLATIYPNLLVVPLTPQADAILMDFERFADDQNLKYAKKNNIAAILWTRVYEAAGRLSLLYACSKNPKEPIIDQDAARWACEFAQWTCEQTNLMVARHVAENAFHAIWLRIEDVIRNNGGHASQSLLINKLKITSKQLQEAIEAMGIGRRIALVEIKTKGRSRMEYVISDTPLDENTDDEYNETSSS